MEVGYTRHLDSRRDTVYESVSMARCCLHSSFQWALATLPHCSRIIQGGTLTNESKTKRGLTRVVGPLSVLQNDLLSAVL